jgi:predicted DCC family thiol-disulfide oxidoreductase YuxK
VISALRDRYLRIDARSLGLFRLAFGIVLLADLFRRWSDAELYYSNAGVLPNHNHLFNLRDTGRIWSAFHSISSAGEAHFGFVVVLFVYLFFLVGYKTRVFHVLSVVALVSLTARNVLLENAGNYAAIALLFFTAFLPCGRRFSLDALVASMRARHEKTADDLNDRGGQEPDFGAGAPAAPERALGYSPTSIAALAVTLQIALVYLCTALQQSGEAWKDGTALYYALFAERWASNLGVSLRGSLSPGLLSALTALVHNAQWVIPVLLFIPIFRRAARGVAIALMIVHGLVLGLLLSLGLFAWTMLAAAALVIPAESWEAARARDARRPSWTVVYDADCGVCLWIARLVKRLDLRSRLRFVGNDALPTTGEEPATALSTTRPWPREVTRELAESTVVLVAPDGRFFTRGGAVARVIGLLPGGWAIAWIPLVPGFAQLVDVLYDAFATRRFRVSEAAGLAACGVPGLADETDDEDEAPVAPAPSTILRRRVTAGLRELGALALAAAMLAQTTKENPLPVSIPESQALAAIALWPRTMARWDVLAPEPPKVAEGIVVDAQTKSGKAIDLWTGAEPDFDVLAARRSRGQLAGDYLYRIHEKDWLPFQKAFKDFLAKRRPEWLPTDDSITGFDVYWVSQAIPAPGQAPSGEPERTKLFTHSRGGRSEPGRTFDKKMPILPPDTLKIPRK